MGEEDLWKIWKDYFEDLYNVDVGEKVSICGFDIARMGYCYESVGRIKLEVSENT